MPKPAHRDEAGFHTVVVKLSGQSKERIERRGVWSLSDFYLVPYISDINGYLC